MKIMRSILLILLGFFIISCNNNITDISGYWEEESSEEQPFTNVLFFENEDGSPTGSVFMLLKFSEVNQVKLENVICKKDSLFYNITYLGISFKGKISQDNKRIDGKITFPDNSEMNVVYNKIIEEEFCSIKQQYIPQQDTSAYIYKKPANLNDGWETSTLLEEKIDTIGIIDIINNIRKGKHGTINSFTIIKNGKLVLDEYFYGYTANDLHFLSSNTKSISSLLTMKALELGYIKKIDDHIFDYLPNQQHLMNNDNSNISIKNILTMKLGFEQAEKDFPIDEDIFEYTLSRKIINKPGEVFFYDNIAPNLLAGIVKYSSGMHIDNFAQKYFFENMNVNDYLWDEGKQNGFPICQGTLELKPRDLAKFGYLMLNNGKWKNKQILSKKYIREMITRNSTIDVDEGIYYGYLWWIADFKIEDKKIEIIYAGGSGGQYLFIIPEYNSIVLFTGNNFNNNKEYELFDILEQKLLKLLEK